VKCVIIVNETLPGGLAANAAAALGLSLGAQEKDLVGLEVRDGDGNVHAGITRVNLPILKADAERLKAIYENVLLSKTRNCGRSVSPPLPRVANPTKSYTEAIARTPLADLRYSAICLFGPSRLVNSLAGTLPTLK
jgi:hypothetical protein